MNPPCFQMDRKTVRKNRSVFLISACLLVLSTECGSEEGTTPVAVTSVPGSAIGTPCGDDTPCAHPEALCLEEFPGGYCSAPCNTQLACPSEHACVLLDGDPVCASSCSSADDCRDGYECITHSVDGNAVSVCDVIRGDVGDGLDDTDMSRDSEGDHTDGGARVHNYGDECLSSAECAATPPLPPSCLSGFEDGYCSASCDPSDGELCGSGAFCLQSSIGGICVLRCGDAEESCRPTYGCCDVGDRHACLPPDTVDGCRAVGPSGEGTLGDRCEEDGDCGAGVDPGCYLDVPGGYCTSWGCRQDSDCGAEGVCLVSFTSLCLNPCTEGGTECREDQECCAVRPDASACVAIGFCEEE